MTIRSEKEFRASIARQLRTGTWVLLLLGGGLGGWAVATDIAGAVLASGNLVVESNVRGCSIPAGALSQRSACGTGTL